MPLDEKELTPGSGAVRLLRSQMRERLSRSPLRAVLTAVAGATVAAAYAHFIGCRTGTCPITSSIWAAGLYGAAVGALVGWPGRQRGVEVAARKRPE